ncbi:MAG: peptide deformylase [Bdellovibrionales bacterium]|nr:peptide deformylase [Bdellovibrionales bacterium]
MAKLEVLKFPDPQLRKKSVPIKEITSELRQLVKDMFETMYDSSGIGLAAPQVNRQIRLFVADTRPRENGRYKLEDMTELERAVEQPFVIFNPEIIKKVGKTTYDEGCLSVPTYYETVQRAELIVVRGLNLEGQKFELEVDGLLAICIQHEIDHLDGKLFIDRLSPIKSTRIKSRIKKLGYPELKDAGENRDDEEVDIK